MGACAIQNASECVSIITKKQKACISLHGVTVCISVCAQVAFAKGKRRCTGDEGAALHPSFIDSSPRKANAFVGPSFFSVGRWFPSHMHVASRQ